MEACCLCSSLKSKGPRRSWDEPLFQSENFVALPSLGSVVQGWVLIVPRPHFICMGALPQGLSAEINNLKWQVAGTLGSIYGDLCAFEHGPSTRGRQAGCGVDHAHLHLVPVHFDLISSASPYLPSDTQWRDGDISDCRTAFRGGQDYLYVEQPFGCGRIAVHDKFGSQIFRKAISARLGFPNRFDWRDHPNLENVTRTVEACRGAASL